MTAASTSPIGIAPPGFRLPDASAIGRVRLQVSDLAGSLEYYRTILGMRVLMQTDATAELGAESGSDVILELRARAGARAVPRRGLLGLYHFAVLLPDRASLGRFVAHLAEAGEYAGMSDHLVSEAVYLTDPDGLGIEVYADRPRATWQSIDRQISMTTKPLDVQSVVAAARGERWSGMPAGTRIGHVHFHVGDISEAEKFYHTALGLDKIVWSYPGALFLSAGGYHHHVGVNTWARGAPPATDEDARLVEWELILPDEKSVEAAASSIESAGFDVEHDGSSILTRDGWGIAVRIRPEA